jgi:hypothetical protein
MGRTNFSAVAVGSTDGSDVGLLLASQSGTITQDSTNAVSRTFKLPPNSRIVDIIVDVTTAFNSATSATLSVGTAAAGTQYAGSVDAKTAAVRIRPTFTGAQLAAMADIGTDLNVVATLTPVGATSAGALRVTIVYSADSL